MGSYTEMKQNMIEAAAAMPADQYDFKLTPPQQSFGGWFIHAASANYYYCHNIAALPPPDSEVAKRMRTLTAKADLQKLIEDSFNYCDRALNGMTDEQAMAEITVDTRKVIPVTFLIGLITGLNEHYGNMVGYLRSKNITPPSTIREAKQK